LHLHLCVFASLREPIRSVSLSIGFPRRRKAAKIILRHQTAGMVIAKSFGTVRNHYMGATGENQNMLGKYVKSIRNQNCPVVLSITSTTTDRESETVIQRNLVHIADKQETSDIYLRAREIYLRARRQRPVRAASIF
jgi:hypothetical protein